ncbi:uncharacterized protein BJ212DRAFT_1271189 [Suillus subaureus]|uniref:ribonuclease H n=1 Tax=Suillus subaureus TaxID=48587 RepID=A0A9P7JDH0_9AGAM|nr:uncharacterized protein BJ212DRAFT_1271189 [Suillus subaureus]KAG1816751.1 hypothetical protein BJ212DRAFT_1271189 [Suillus subaureus]
MKGKITFDPSLTIRTCLLDCFRIFRNDKNTNSQPALRLEKPTRGLNLIDDKITIFTDRSCINNGKANAKCESSIWVAENHEKNKAIRVLGPSQSNQIGELTTILVALQNTDPFIPINFKTDSKYVIEGLTKNLKTWEDNGWTNIENADTFKATAYQLRKRSAQTTFEWIKGHSGNEGNEATDSLAKRGAEKETCDQINLEIPTEFDVQGAKLSKMTQTLAYQNLKNQYQIKQWRTTKRNLETARYAIKEISNNLESDKTIWKECRRKDIQRPIQQFLYKALHSTHKVGDFWSNIPQYEQRAKCAICHNETEPMAHILTTCCSNERRKIWKLIKDIWPKKYSPWPRIMIGTILGCRSIHISKQNNNNTENITPTNNNIPNSKHIPGASRLFQILISESAHLIWAIGCERIIGNKNISNKTIETRWTNKINMRITIDRTIANKIDTNTQKLVKTTWSEIISSTTHIPENWVTNPEVLVGIKPPRPSTEQGHQV